MEETLQLYETDEFSDDEDDIYGADPVFESKEELDKFMASCDIQYVKKSDCVEEKVCYEQQKGLDKLCSCGKCEDIWSGDFQHLCCQQINK